jgi:hypothetical protein
MEGPRKDQGQSHPAGWMELEIILLNEISQSPRQASHGFFHFWKLGKNKTKQPSHESKRETTRELKGVEKSGKGG